MTRPGRGPRRHYEPTHRERSFERTMRVAGVVFAGARIGGWVVLVAAVAALVVLGIGPRTGRYRTLTVLSGSMTPGIPVGAVIVDTPERPDQLTVGQVITYQIPVGDHRVESHRVVKVLQGGSHPVFQTKGDANATADPWTAKVTGSTVWRLRAVVPYAGWVIIDLRRPVVHNVLIWVVPGLLALVWLAQIWRQPEEAVAQGPGREGRHAPVPV